MSLVVMGGNPSLLYATTKGAIIQMTRAMASHYGLDQIRVNCVAPGMVYTPMVRGRGMVRYSENPILFFEHLKSRLF